MAGSTDEAVRALKSRLLGLGATDVHAVDREVTFRVPVTARRPQSSVDSGRCVVVTDSSTSTVVTVELSFTRTVVVLSTVIVVWLGGMGWLVLGVSDPWELGFLLALGFCWLHGAGYVAASWWFKRELELGPI